MIVGEVNFGDEFVIEYGQHGSRWFRKVGALLHNAGLMHPHILLDAITGFPTTSLQNADVVQDLRTGQFFFIDCDVECLPPIEDDEDGE